MAFFKTKTKNKNKKKPIKKPISMLNTSVIAQGLSIEGNLNTKLDLDISGLITGNIICNSLIVREDGIIEGDIEASDTVRVIGKVNGNIKASSIFIEQGGRVEGNVYQESLIIEDGAFLDGQCKRLNDDDFNNNLKY